MLWTREFNKTEVPVTKRYLYYAVERIISSCANKGIVITITGARRAGKTTILKQLADKLDNALYLSVQENINITVNESLQIWDKIAEGYKIFCIDEVSLLSNVEASRLISLLKQASRDAVFVISGSVSFFTQKVSWAVCSGPMFELLPRTYTEHVLMRDSGNFAGEVNPYEAREIVEVGNDWRFKDYLTTTVYDNLNTADNTVRYLEGALSDVIVAYERNSSEYASKLYGLRTGFSDTIQFMALCQVLYRKSEGRGNFIDIQDNFSRLFKDFEIKDADRDNLRARLERIAAVASMGVKNIEVFLEFLNGASLVYESRLITDLKDLNKYTPYYLFAYPWFTSTVFDSVIEDQSIVKEVRHVVQSVMVDKWVEAILANCIHNIMKVSGHYRDERQQEIDIITMCPTTGVTGIEVKNREFKSISRSYLKRLQSLDVDRLIVTTSNNVISSNEVGVISNELLLRRLETCLISQTLVGRQLIEAPNLGWIIDSKSVIKI